MNDGIETITVQLKQQSYPIYIGQNVLRAELLARFITGSQVLIVSNQTIAPLYLNKVKENLPVDVNCEEYILPDGEKYKNVEYWSHILETLVKKGYQRDSTLVALGGGVVGDITGFAASCYQRGVSFIQIPTSLLAQVDASVGGKTAINFAGGKNMVGSFYQPKAVFIDTTTLKTLNKRDYVAGFAEIIKYAMLASNDFFSWLEKHIHKLLKKDDDSLKQVIKTCCSIKSHIVSIDEKEKSGKRALLNLGHTFAHAFEAVSRYERWHHGEAVAIGLQAAALLSNRMNKIDKTLVERIEKLIKEAQLPISIPSHYSVNDIYALMQKDKKIEKGKRRFILLHGLGKTYIDSQVDKEDVLWALNQVREK